MTDPLDSSHWPGWLSGVGLALVPMAYYLLHGRLMAVSGRYTLLVNRWRFGAVEPDESIDSTELLEALREASVEAFGAEAVEQESRARQSRSRRPGASLAAALRRAPARHSVSLLGHGVFLLGLVLGGVVGGPRAWPRWSLDASKLESWAGSAGAPVSLLLAGVLVGFGTRMCGGCTVGHGLCGLPRAQPGSVLSTLAFFGAGVVVALLLAGV